MKRQDLIGLRKQKNLSQYELAKRFGVSQGLIWAIENGSRNVNDELKLKYYNFFSKDITELFFSQNDYK